MKQENGLSTTNELQDLTDIGPNLSSFKKLILSCAILFAISIFLPQISLIGWFSSNSVSLTLAINLFFLKDHNLIGLALILTLITFPAFKIWLLWKACTSDDRNHYSKHMTLSLYPHGKRFDIAIALLAAMTIGYAGILNSKVSIGLGAIVYPISIFFITFIQAKIIKASRSFGNLEVIPIKTLVRSILAKAFIVVVGVLLIVAAVFGALVYWGEHLQFNSRMFQGSTSTEAHGSNTYSSQQSSNPESCVNRGINYYKSIGSYPYLKSEPYAGRSAESVAREKCSNSPLAFGK